MAAVSRPAPFRCRQGRRCAFAPRGAGTASGSARRASPPPRSRRRAACPLPGSARGAPPPAAGEGGDDAGERPPDRRADAHARGGRVVALLRRLDRREPDSAPSSDLGDAARHGIETVIAGSLIGAGRHDGRPSSIHTSHSSGLGPVAPDRLVRAGNTAGRPVVLDLDLLLAHRVAHRLGAGIGVLAERDLLDHARLL